MKTYTDQEMRRIIIDHYTKPRLFGLTGDSSLELLNLDSSTCSDKLQIEFQVIDNKIQKLRFGGMACAIAMASTDLLITKIENKTIPEVLSSLQNYEHFIINHNQIDFSDLGELVVFKNVHKQKGRIKCATLTSRGLQEYLLSLTL